MTALPKPKKRGPKPRKRITRRTRPHAARVSTSLKIALFARGQKGKLRVLTDDIQSLYVRHLANWTCWACSSTKSEEMQAAHLLPKGEYHAGRYLADLNVRCLCFRCHKYWTERPTEWTKYLVRRLGSEAFEQLRDVCSVRCGPHDYALEARYYRTQLEAMPALWKVQERFDALVKQGQTLGVWV